MPKPSDSMEWASDVGAQVVEPIQAKKEAGWLTAEKPPAQYFNWWMNNAYLWQQYFEVTTDALLGGSSTLTSTTDITIIFDSDNNGTTNAALFQHDGSTEVARIDESANFLLNQATAGTNGVGLIGLKNGTVPATQPADISQIYTADFAAGDSRLHILTEQGGSISIGNNSIRNANTDGTLTLASEKHVTVDIDSDNDGTDGVFTVRTNAATDVLSVSEVANVSINAATFGTNAAGTLALKNGTAPTTNVTDVVQLYPDDFAAGDSRLYIRSESGSPMAIGNDAIRSINSDGTLTVASEKHITMDIDSDNDGVDAIWKVRANGTTDALTVTEAGLVTATGNVIGSNIVSTNRTDITTALLNAERAAFLTFHQSQDTTVLGASNLISICGTSSINSTSTGNAGSIVIGSADTAVDVVYARYGDPLDFGAKNLTGTNATRYIDTNGTNYVRVGNAGEIFTATDPDGTWTARTSGTANALGTVFYGNGLWIAGGASSTILYSADAITWAAASSIPAASSWNTTKRSAYGNGYWVMLSTSSGVITVSTTGSGTWTNYTVTGMTSIDDVIFDGTRFLLVGGGAANIEIYYATDPTGSWTASLDSNSSTYITTNGLSSTIIYTGNQWIVYGISDRSVPVAWVSTDLSTWTMYPCQVSNKTTSNNVGTNALRALYCSWNGRRVYLLSTGTAGVYISNPI